MKNTTNVFLKGMTSDMHPLTTSQQEYTDALNATLITFNGNEQMMQNDMGNTLIQDSKTGNIMGLREGFVPVGLKEHGGIMYIASVNKDRVGEIGTIPSPVIRYNKEKNYENEIHTILEATPSFPSKFYKLTSEKLNIGEKFAVALQLEDDNLTKTVEYSTYNSTNILEYPMYSSNNVKGLYNIKLYAQTDDQIFDINDQIKLNSEKNYTYSVKDPNKIDNSKVYWFANVKNQNIANSVDFDIDTMLVQENSDNENIKPFIHYPNVPSGYPSIRFETENIDSFSLSINRAQNQIYPLTRCDIIEDQLNYTAIFSYFIYNTKSAVHVDKMIVSVSDSNGNQQMLHKITDSSDNTILEFDFNLGEIQRYRISDNEFALIKNIKQGEITNFDLIPNATDSKFNTEYNNALFTMEIGENLDQWFILNVKYYNNEWDEPIGEYNLRFNQYMMDVKHKFIILKVEPEKNNIGDLDYRTQKYDRSKDLSDQVQFVPDTEQDVTDITLNYDISLSSENLSINGTFQNFSSYYDAYEFPMIYLYDDEYDRKVRYNLETTSDSYNFGSGYGAIINNSPGTDFSTGFNHFSEYCKITDSNIDDSSNIYANSSAKSGSISVKMRCDILTEDGKIYESSQYFSQYYRFIDKNSLDYPRGFREDSSSNSEIGSVKIFGNDFNKYIQITNIRVGNILKKALNDWHTNEIRVDSYNNISSNIKSFKITISEVSISGALCHAPNDYNPSGYTLYFDKTNNGDTASTLKDINNNSAGNVSFNGTNASNTKTISARYKITYLPYSEDPKTFLNKGDFKIMPQYNLFGLNKSNMDPEYNRYGIITKNENIDLVESNIIPTENYLLSVFLDNTIFVEDSYNYESSLDPIISIKKLVSRDKNTNVSIPAGIYYLGSIIRSKSDTSFYIQLTFLDQLTNEFIVSKLYSVTSTDNYYERSGNEGGLLYLPNGGVLTNIKLVNGDINDAIIQDLGLYELNLDFDSEPNIHISDFITKHNKISYESNKSENGNIGYYYATPQLCWTFVESNDRCVKKSYNMINYGMHAYQTKFGEYYTTISKYDTSPYTYILNIKNTINLPDGSNAYINYRVKNE